MLVPLLFAVLAGVAQSLAPVHHLTCIPSSDVVSADVTVETGVTPATVVRVERVAHPSGGNTDRLIVFLVDEMHVPEGLLPPCARVAHI